MSGCCLAAIILSLGPRFVLILACMMSNWYDAFETGWMAFLAWIFMPWTSLAWMYIYFNNAGDISGGYLVLMIMSVIMDIGGWQSNRTVRVQAQN